MPALDQNGVDAAWDQHLSSCGLILMAQDCNNSIANTLELLQFCTKPYDMTCLQGLAVDCGLGCLRLRQDYQTAATKLLETLTTRMSYQMK